MMASFVHNVMVMKENQEICKYYTLCVHVSF